jgi:hypothetical protein
MASLNLVKGSYSTIISITSLDIYFCITLKSRSFVIISNSGDRVVSEKLEIPAVLEYCERSLLKRLSSG